MNKHFILALICSIAIGSSALASENQEGILCYQTGLYSTAKQILKKNLTAYPDNKAETYFYLGKVAFAEKQVDSAKIYFLQGIAADPELVINKIGQLQCQLLEDKKTTDGAFKSLLKANKKNAEVSTEICRAYWECNDADYKPMLETLKEKFDKESVYYLLTGDIFSKEGNPGDACSQYEQAIYFDEKCEIAYLKYAIVYTNNNSQAALDMLHKLLKMNPQSILGKRYIAEIYFSMNQFGDAAKYYGEYLNEDIFFSKREIERYATILFYSKDFEGARTQIAKVIKDEPSNLIMNRLTMYINMETEANGSSLAQADEFMKVHKAEEYIPLDYSYYASLLKKGKRYQDAIVQFEKTLKLDTTKKTLYRDIADSYASLGDYKNAATQYKSFFKCCNDEVKLSDFLLYGQNCYRAAGELKTTADSSLAKGYMLEADSAFAKVCERSPENALGYFWRARVQSTLDPETTLGLAKPFYEKALSILENNGKDTRKMLECYQYLGFYYYVKEDFNQSLNYWNKVLALDPTNDVATKAASGIQAHLQGQQKKK